MDKEKDNTQNNRTDKGQPSSSEETEGLSSGAGSSIEKAILTENEKIAAIASKAEKLATATYMVTSFIPDYDLLKIKIREATVDFLSDIYASSNASFYDRVGCYKHALSACVEISGFLSVAASVNLISGMNCGILNREYDSLKQTLKSFDGVVEIDTDSLITAAGSFFGERRDSGFLQTTQRENSLFSNDYKGQNLIKDKNQKEMSFTPKKTNKTDKVTGVRKGQEKHKSDRRESILKVLRKKKNVTIKDISNAISDCSEKTIQRELLALVSDGVLKKEGEKRWSRYSLN